MSEDVIATCDEIDAEMTGAGQRYTRRQTKPEKRQLSMGEKTGTGQRPQD